MKLELDALAGAVAQLEKSLAYARSSQASADPGLGRNRKDLPDFAAVRRSWDRG